MNAASMPSTISSTVAAEIFGPGSFFGSCQVSSSNFEVLFDNVLKQSDAEWKKESGTILQSEGLLEIENSDELSNILQIFMQGKSESEVMQQLKAILGDEAGVEAFERIVALLEKGSLSVQKDMDNLSLLDFIDLSESLLERLELVIKQISYVNEALVIKQNIQNEDLFEMEKFLNLLSDLLKIGLITPQTFEQAIQNQDYANLPELLEELREEVEKLLFSLNIEEKKTEKKNDLKFAEIKDFEKIEIENFAKNKEIKAEIKTEAKLELKNFTKAEIKDFIKNTEIKSEAKAEIKAEAKAENKPEAKAESVIKDFAKTEMKTGKLPKAEPEVRAVWEGADLKIETINPKTGEKLQSVPVSNAHRMQEQMNQFEVVRQVVAQAKFITTPTGEQKMTIQLRPEHLGQVELRISLHNGEMQIHARVESATAQAALENHIGLLREGLEKQGITLERLEVSVEQRENRDAYALAREQEQKRDGKNNRRKKGQAAHLAVSVAKDANADTGRRLGYNTMEYLA